MRDESEQARLTRRAHEQLKRAAYFAELACESLCPVDGQVERWERLRGLVFALREERDALEDLLDFVEDGAMT